MMNDSLLKYFNGDELAASVWKGKYAMKGEELPSDMHKRMAREFARIEEKYPQTSVLSEEVREKLSEFGRNLQDITEGFVMHYLDKFAQIVPQGSIMTMLGNKYKTGSLSNCFVIPSPVDSYGGILKTDQELVQLMKRRGGVGMNINTLRPANTPVSNAAGSSTGAVSFMHRYSNSTREVAQNGRRGALMLLIDCRHPDVFQFVTIKKDRTQVTGANVSVMLTDKFMEAVEKEEDFICTFPINYDWNDFLYTENQEIGTVEFKLNPAFDLNYNKLSGYKSRKYGMAYFMKIKARELYDLIVEMAWDNAEPGVAFIDRVKEYCPEGVYPQFTPIASNPCGEQWMQAYDACRLLALNLFSIVKNKFTEESWIDYDLLYEIAYVQQRLADDIVDLELEYIDKIISKIKSDPEPEEVKRTELLLWENVKAMTQASRRTGCGITALGDMLAAINCKYDSDEAMKITQTVMQTKMRAELDCTIDLAILRGTFEGWDREKEFTTYGGFRGLSKFYEMLQSEFLEQAIRMNQYGRRNVSWSTVAPTGTVSILTQTTSGLEPLFSAYYMRRKKVNALEKGVRVDFTDQNGDTWQEYPVLHPKFKEWLFLTEFSTHDEDRKPFEGWLVQEKNQMQQYFEKSPWYKSTANDISWEKRIEIQSIIQRYTTNAISSTINLPNDVSKEVVSNIYLAAWKSGLKGVTIYRDGCRTGVLVTETTKKSSFEYTDAAKRPKGIDADLHVVTVKGIKYGVVIGKMDDKPYEVFAFNAPTGVKESAKGEIVKVKRGHYNFISEDEKIENIQDIAVRHDEQVLTRLISGMLRHGAKPQFVMEQIDKCDLEVVSFGKAISRTLKKYVKEDELISRNKCSDCGSTNLRMQEGCLTCNDCGTSRCS